MPVENDAPGTLSAASGWAIRDIGLGKDGPETGEEGREMAA
jgi:hypothetical protein